MGISRSMQQDFWEWFFDPQASDKYGFRRYSVNSWRLSFLYWMDRRNSTWWLTHEFVSIIELFGCNVDSTFEYGNCSQRKFLAWQSKLKWNKIIYNKYYFSIWCVQFSVILQILSSEVSRVFCVSTLSIRSCCGNHFQPIQTQFGWEAWCS